MILERGKKIKSYPNLTRKDGEGLFRNIFCFILHQFAEVLSGNRHHLYERLVLFLI